MDKTPLLRRLIGKAFAPLARAVGAEKAISDRSFGYDHIESFEVGKLVKGKGIYMGEWEPADLDGQPLGFKLSVFVSSKPLKEVTGRLLTFNDTAVEIGRLKGWQGHDGCNLDPARYYADFCEKLRRDPEAVLGKWMIGPLELVSGWSGAGEKVRSQNMYDLRNKGDFGKAKPFVTTPGSGYVRWQWSCTPYRAIPARVRAADFSDGSGAWFRRDYAFGCVPVRLERLAL
jgi:hypothetical protein